MNKTQALLNAVYLRGIGTTNDLCRDSSVDLRSAHKAIAKLVRKGRLTKGKLREGSSYNSYWMTADQQDDYERRYLGKKPLEPTVSVYAKLKFLENLATRPAFEGHAVLRQIIQDYRDARSKAHAQEGGIC